MSFKFKRSLILSSRRVLLPEGERAATVHVEEGLISRIESHAAARQHPTCIDLGRYALIPGLIDPHVHLNDPGNSDWEGFETGTAAAAAGGITTLVDMPLNSLPVTTTPEALAAKRRAAEGRLSVDVGFHGGLVPGNAESIAGLLDAGAIGIKAFLCDSGLAEFPAVTRADLEMAMPILAARDKVLLAHAERTHPVPQMKDPRNYADYLASRPPTFEKSAIRLLIELCAKTGCRTHIVHLSDAGCLPMLAEARRQNLPITVETCPHYLTFAAEDIPDGATQFKCAPPIREESNRQRLWQGLAYGEIDMIASDHSPCPVEMKDMDAGRFDQAWGGISSLQVGLPVVWSEARRRGHSLDEVINWMCHTPGRIFGIENGIQVGSPANFAFFDEEYEFFVNQDQLRHRHKVTPYHGKKYRGAVQKTYLRGELAYQGGGRTL